MVSNVGHPTSEGAYRVVFAASKALILASLICVVRALCIFIRVVAAIVAGSPLMRTKHFLLW